MQVSRQKRIVILFLGVFICFLALVFRLAFIQLGQAGHLSGLARDRDTASLSLEEYERGDILDRKGRSLTGAYQSNRVVIFPFAIGDQEKVIEELAAIFNTGPQVLEPYFSQGPVYLPFDLSSLQAKKVKTAFGAGVSVLPVCYRYGPDSCAVHITGHLSRASSREVIAGHQHDWIGVMGLEKHYEDQLKGDLPVRSAYLPVDARGRLVGPAGEIRLDDKHLDAQRHDVVTTIDIDVQQAVERVFDRRAGKGAVVVMQAGSGDILACASRPAFNPDPGQIVNDSTQEGVFINRALALFQPGSLFKLVLAGAALEEGIAGPESKFSCAGARDIPIRCWYAPGHEEITLHQAVVHSCNPAFVQLGERLGAKLIIEYAKKMGLDNSFITGLPGASAPRQHLEEIAAPYNLSNCSIGQGPVLVTPVQLTAMMNVIASGGDYYQPRIVRALSRAGGETTDFPSSPGENILSPATLLALQAMLAAVTQEGAGKNAFVAEGGSAGKTGSAQVYDHGQESINAWFSGYLPLDEPRYVITVLVEGGESGAETAAPLFKEIAEELMAGS